MVRRLLGGLAAATLLAVASTAHAISYNTNLISNPGAEAGNADAAGDTFAVPGWTTTGAATAVLYGPSDGFPDVTSPGPGDRGTKFFAGGPSNAASALSQAIDVSSLATDVDTGTVSYTLSGYFGGFSGQNDHANLTAFFTPSEGFPVLGSGTVGGVSAADRDSVTGLLFRTVSGKVPTGTRLVTLNLGFTRTDGSYNDGYADDVSLTLSKGGSSPVPEPAMLSTLLVGGSLYLLRRKAQKA